MPGVQFHTATLTRGTLDPLEEILRQIGTEPRGPVMVVGLESAVPSSAEYHPVLQSLNLQRPKWPEKIPQPVVLWVPEYLLGLLGRQAPDFLDWRSDTIFFPPLTEPALKAMDSVSWAGGADGRMDEPDRRERIHELESRLATHGESDDPVVQKALVLWMSEIANHYYLLGELDKAMSLLKEQERLCRELGYKQGLQASLGNQALILQARGNLNGAMALYKEQERLYRELGDLRGLVPGLGNQALILRARGELGGAMSLLKEQERLCRELGYKQGLEVSLGNQAVILKDHGDLDGAMALHKEKERLCRELGDKEGLAVSLGNQALILMARGDLDGAMALHKEEERLCHELGHKDGLEASLGNQALILRAWGRLDEAMALHKEEERLCRELGDPVGLALSLANQASLLAGPMGKAREALPLAEEAYRLAVDHGLTVLAQQVKQILDYVRSKLG
jgi:tetratricopeptide (TPR) repeat protein